MMVIGLHSGKEFIVDDKSYYITIGDTLKQVFISPDGKRRYTITESEIDFYDEVNSQEYMDKLHQTMEQTIEQRKNLKEGVSYV